MRSLVLCVVSAILFTACAPSQRGDVYSRKHAQQAHEVTYGEIVDIRNVTIEGSSDIRGAAAGGVLGYALGNAVGGGSGKKVAKAAGGVGGAMAGAKAQQKATEAQGVELTVKLETGKTYVIVQEKDDAYRVGDRVRVLRARDGTMRVRL